MAHCSLQGGFTFVAIVHFVMGLALLEYFGFVIAVGRARIRCGIAAPAVTGHPEFERYYRIQMNTLEQLIIVLPSLWTFAVFVSPQWAAGLGLVFVIGRLIYFVGYARDASKRGLGFGISSLPMLILLVGGIIGAGMAALR
jgi:hypothetical protein